jgi:hypothetical protein
MSKRISENETHKTKRLLSKTPTDRHDPSYRLDPYWVLRNKGYSHSSAKRALRGEPVRVVALEECEAGSSGSPYEIDLSILGVTDLSLTRARYSRVEIVMRPEELTEQIVEDAGPIGKEYSISDGRVSGLTLRIRASGHKSYVLYYRMGYRSKKIRIATAGDITLERAREIAREHRAVVAMGEDPATCSLSKIQARRRRRERRLFVASGRHYRSQDSFEHSVDQASSDPMEDVVL